MLQLLFSLPSSEMEAIFQRYHAKAPPPLTAQFPNRLSRAAAIERQGLRQQARLNAQLFPTGN